MDVSDIEFQSRVRNALTAITKNPYLHGEVKSAFQIMPCFYFLKIIVNNGMFLVHALCMDDGYECRLFLDGIAVRILVLDPMTEDVQNAIKDYHSIGHR